MGLRRAARSARAGSLPRHSPETWRRRVTTWHRDAMHRKCGGSSAFSPFVAFALAPSPCPSWGHGRPPGPPVLAASRPWQPCTSGSELSAEGGAGWLACCGGYRACAGPAGPGVITGARQSGSCDAQRAPAWGQGRDRSRAGGGRCHLLGSACWRQLRGWGSKGLGLRAARCRAAPAVTAMPRGGSAMLLPPDPLLGAGCAAASRVRLCRAAPAVEGLPADLGAPLVPLPSCPHYSSGPGACLSAGQSCRAGGFDPSASQASTEGFGSRLPLTSPSPSDTYGAGGFSRPCPGRAQEHLLASRRPQLLRRCWSRARGARFHFALLPVGLSPGPRS